MNRTFLRRLVFTLAATAGLVTAAAGPAAAGSFNHCEPLTSAR